VSRIARASFIFGGLVALQATAWLGIGPLARSGGDAPSRPTDSTVLPEFASAGLRAPTVATDRFTSTTAARASRGERTGPRELGTFKITCYVLRGTTKSGLPASAAVVAVDPKVIRLGSRVYVDGFGSRIAADTGRLVKGRHIDVWMSSYRKCVEFGVQRRTVWLESVPRGR
jgi:3D (Asp-Asp-Asp) domain-containing protein